MIFHRCKSLIFQTIRNPLILQKTHDSVHLFVQFYSSSETIPINSTNAILNLLQKHDFSPRIASKVASSLSSLKDAEKCDSVLTFLKDTGFSAAQLEKALIKMPNLLAFDLDTAIKPKIKIFENLGFSATDIADIVCAHPNIFTPNGSSRLVPSIMALKKVLVSISQVAKVLKQAASRSYLKRDLETTMLPNIDYLNTCGIRIEQILKHVFVSPSFLLQRPETMKQNVQKAEEEMGCSRDSKMFIYAVRTIAFMSEKSLKEKLQIFRDMGFSDEQILVAFQNQPQVFSVSCKKIHEASSVILASGYYGISDIFRSPLVFICGVDKTLKPRLHVLDILLKRNLLKKPPGFYVTHLISKQMFFDRFIVRYLGEVDEIRRLDGWSKEFSKLDSIVCS